MDYIFNPTCNPVKLNILRSRKEITLEILSKCRAYLKPHDLVPEKSTRQKNLEFKISQDKIKKEVEDNKDYDKSVDETETETEAYPLRKGKKKRT